MKRIFHGAMAAGMLMAAGTANAETIYGRVEGMTCASCAQSIEAMLLTHCAVQAVRVDVAKDSLVVVEKPAKHISDTALDTLVRKAGYRLASFTRRPI